LLSSWYQVIALEYLPVFPWVADDDHFLTSWKTGAAVLLILHYSNPDCVDLHRVKDAYVAEGFAEIANHVNFALNTAFSNFGVEKLLSAQDIIETRSSDELPCIIYLCNFCIATIPHADDFREARQKRIYDERRQSRPPISGDTDDLRRLTDMTIELDLDGNKASPACEQKITMDELEDTAFNIKHMVSMLRVKLDDCVPRRSIAFRRDDVSLNLSKERSATPSTFSEASLTSASVEDDDVASLHSARTVHPLQAVDDDNVSYEMTLENTIEAAQQYRSHDMQNFYSAAQELQRQFPEYEKRIQVMSESIKELEQSLAYDMIEAKNAFQLFERGYRFSKQARSVRSELDFIQAKMVKTTTTNTGITELEDRGKHAFEAITNLQTGYGDLLDSVFPDQSYRNNLDAIVQKYELVQAWVEEVRIWFAEAERIRVWIESRISILEEKKITDPLQEDVQLTQTEVETLNCEHEALEQDIELFNKEDMTRLRAHVKALTGSDRGDKDLSPADTTTIEITLTTLMTLDRLMHLLRQKTYTLQILTLRVLWEDEFSKAIKWVNDGDEEITCFLRGEARWRTHVDFLIDGSTEHTLRKSQMELRTAVINQLLALEHSIADFDQGQFTATLNIFQDLEDAHGADLPPHLEARQTGLESAFEVLTGRVSFSRKVVEQRLAMMEYVQQFTFVKNEGTKLLQDLDHLCAHAAPNMDVAEINQRFQVFESNVAHLSGPVTARITYPHHNTAVDEVDNADSNLAIQTFLESSNSDLDSMAVSILAKLNQLRQLIEEHNEANDILIKLDALKKNVYGLMDDAEKCAVDINAMNVKHTELDVMRLKATCNESLVYAKSLKNTDFDPLYLRLHTLSSVADKDVCSIDFPQLFNKLSHLESKLDDYAAFLRRQFLLLGAFEHRLKWEFFYGQTCDQIVDTNARLCDETKMMRWRPVEMLALMAELTKSPNSASATGLQDFHEDLEMTLGDLKENALAMTTGLFSTLLSAYAQVHKEIDSRENQAFIDHIQQLHSKMHLMFDELNTIYAFNGDLLNQRGTICDLLDDVARLENDGKTWLEQMQQMTVSSSQQKIKVDFTVQIDQFVKGISALFPSRITEIPLLRQPSIQHLPCLSNEDDDALDQAIRLLLVRREKDLLIMADDLKGSQERYRMTLDFKAKVLEYEQCAADLCTWMLQQSQDLANQRLQLKSVAASLDQAELDSVIHAQHQRSREINEIARQKLEDLGLNITELDNALVKKEASDVDISPATSAYDLAVADMAILIHVMEGHGRDIDARKQHLLLHQLLLNSQQEATIYSAQINQLSDELDHLIDNDLTSDIQQSEVMEIMSRCSNIDDELMEFDARIGTEIRIAQADLERLCSQLLEPEGPPMDLTRRISEFDDCYIKLRESTGLLRARIDRLNECLDCLNAVADNVHWYHTQEEEIRRFVDNKARWNVNIDPAQVDIQKLGEEIDNLKINLEICESQNIEPCVATLREIKGSFSDLNSVNMIKRLESAQHALEIGLQRVHDHTSFAHTIIAQNRSASWYLVKIAGMQQQAEAIKKDLLCHSMDNASRLDEMSVLEAQMLATQQESNMRISYPVRSFNGYIEQDAQSDNAVNNVLQDTVKSKNVHLQQSLANIKSIVQSNERMSRRMEAIQHYNDQAKTFLNWHQSKSNVLDQTYGESCDVSKLTLEDKMICLAKIQAIDSAFKAYQPTYNDLKTTAVETIAYLSSQDPSDAGETSSVDSMELIKSVKDSQSHIDVKCDELSSACGKAIMVLEADIEAHQLEKSLSSLVHTCDNLRTEMNVANRDDVNAQTITEWTEKMETLGLKPIASLREQYAHVMSQREGLSLPPADQNQALLDRADQLAEQIKISLQQHAQHLKTRDTLDLYLGNGSAILNDLHDKNLTLSKFNATSGYLIRDFKVDAEQQQTILTMIKNMEVEAAMLEDKYQRYCEQIPSELAFQDQVATQKSDIESAIQNLQNDLLKTTNISTRYATALSHQEVFIQIKSEMLPQIDTLLHTLSADVDDTSSMEELTQTMDAVKVMLQRLQNEQRHDSEDQSQDVNQEFMQTQYAEVQTAIEQASSSLIEIKAKREQTSPLKAFSTACSTLQDLCKEQANLVLITMESTSKSQFYAKDSTFVERLLRQSINGHNSAETEYKRLGSQLDYQKVELEHIEGGPEQAVALDGAHQAWDRLRTMLDREQRQLDFLRKAFAFTKACNEINAWMEGCKRALHNVDSVTLDDQRSQLDDMHTKVNSFEATIKAFNTMVSSLIKDKNDQVIDFNAICVKDEDVLAAIDMRSGRVLTEWDALKKQFVSIQCHAESNLQAMTISRKSKEIFDLVDKIKHHLSSLSVVQSRTSDPVNMQDLPLSQLISERDVIVVEAQMTNLEKEVEYHLNKKITDLDMILASFPHLQNDGGEFVQQRAEIAKVVTELANHMEEKHQEIGAALKLAGFVNVVDELEVLLTAVQDALTPCTNQPKTGRMPSKADIQALLIELDTRFKYYGPRIREKLDETKHLASVFVDDARIIQKYNQVEKQWNQLHVQVAQVKAELNGKISDMRQATPTPSTNLDRQARPHSVAGVRTRKISEQKVGRAMTPTPRSSNSSLTSRIYEPVSATQVPRMRRATLTPVPSRSKSGKGTSVPPRYIPDPRSDLDVQLGKVVNESPYKIRIKMVPGEVGKYWFGEVEPRLVYCRILRSNMVMVRVGGGWTELSQFLRDHALLEGRLIPNRRDEKKQPDVREAYLRTTRPKENASMSEEVPGHESSDPVKMSRSTPSRGITGVKEGNRFLMTVDGEGNQLEISMKKATDHEPRLVSTPRRSHQQ
jgi:Growth-Arrest-Specific Protein 2 Domain/Calponin homology (CH) domain